MYFGPFVSASERDALLRVIKRIFCLRSCKKLPKRACLRYHMKSCSAPCIGLISGEDYHQHVERASALLKGKRGGLSPACRTGISTAEGEERRAVNPASDRDGSLLGSTGL